MTIALEYPSIEHLLVWREFWLPGLNKPGLLAAVGALIVFAFFFIGSRQAALVPRGAQNLVEVVVEFVRENIILQTMGPAGLMWLPFLTTLFCFVLITNLFEVIPFIQFPVNARMAVPASLALMCYVIYNFMGIKRQGFFGYLKSTLIPPGVPKGILPIVVLIEFVSNILLRPFTHAVRLFANMLAGHLLLVTFAVLSAALWDSSPLIAIMPLPAVMLVVFTGFEVLVAVLQAFIFTILMAVYLDLATHPHH